ncbi:MAG: 6,7-dimethyl-8-ribityllumazine synthase [Lautropia sp.]|nr:6,7-dimethyl-8-ribityllumazine synthase [Lautropia sp.]
MSVDRLIGTQQGDGLRIGIVYSRFNEDHCNALLDSCLAELKKLGVAEEDTLVCSVPGALEIPLALLQLGNTGEFDALIALGAIVKGETYHFEVVCNESAAGVSRVSLELGIPVANAILTTYDDEQAQQRVQVKGAEAAQVAIEMATLGTMLDSLSIGDDDAEE